MSTRLFRRQLLLSTALAASALTGYGRRAYGACVPVGGSQFECSGANSTSQTITFDDADVSTVAGFSVDVTGVGVGLDIRGNGDLSYTDTNGSDLKGIVGLFVSGGVAFGTTPGSVTIVTDGNISGEDTALSALNWGVGGALSITTGGDVASTGFAGIDARNFGTDLTLITNGAVSGDAFGMTATNYGGALQITANGDVTGTDIAGISVYNGGAATSATVTTAAGTTVTGHRHGIAVENRGEALEIIANGDVSAISTAVPPPFMIYSGIYAVHQGTDLTVTVGASSTVSGSTGIFVGSIGSGTHNITIEGDVIGTGR